MLYSFENRLVFRAEAQQPFSERKPKVIVSPEYLLKVGESAAHFPVLNEHIKKRRGSVESLLKGGYPDAIPPPEPGRYEYEDLYSGKEVQFMTESGEFFGNILAYDFDTDDFFVRDKDGVGLNVKRKYVRLHAWGGQRL